MDKGGNPPKAKFTINFYNHWELYTIEASKKFSYPPSNTFTTTPYMYLHLAFPGRVRKITTSPNQRITYPRMDPYKQPLDGSPQSSLDL
jgi:hypothetical protein